MTLKQERRQLEVWAQGLGNGTMNCERLSATYVPEGMARVLATATLPSGEKLRAGDFAAARTDLAYSKPGLLKILGLFEVSGKSYANLATDPSSKALFPYASDREAAHRLGSRDTVVSLKNAIALSASTYDSSNQVVIATEDLRKVDIGALGTSRARREDVSTANEYVCHPLDGAQAPNTFSFELDYGKLRIRIRGPSGGDEFFSGDILETPRGLSAVAINPPRPQTPTPGRQELLLRTVSKGADLRDFDGIFTVEGKVIRPQGEIQVRGVCWSSK
jgi:hypothetical protein